MRRLLTVLALVLAGAAPASAQSQAPDAFVSALYAAHLPAIEGNGDGVLFDDALRARFFAPDLAAAIKKDSDDAERRQDVGALDFDPVTDSQDPVVRKLAIAVLSADAGRATVQATFDRGGGPRAQLIYDLAVIDGDWKVRDISNPARGDAGWDLRALLKLQ